MPIPTLFFALATKHGNETLWAEIKTKPRRFHFCVRKDRDIAISDLGDWDIETETTVSTFNNIYSLLLTTTVGVFERQRGLQSLSIFNARAELPKLEGWENLVQGGSTIRFGCPQDISTSDVIVCFVVCKIEVFSFSHCSTLRVMNLYWYKRRSSLCKNWGRWHPRISNKLLIDWQTGCLVLLQHSSVISARQR